ncbi:phospholipid scramblase 2-like [Amia ocellicauda]|uniref:phospholipid scramblase 2-like n=1 Tax=Amia ocellicauda TaxID=2972642 RepID=UPI003464912B
MATRHPRMNCRGHTLTAVVLQDLLGNLVDQVLLHPQRELLEEFDALPCTEKFQIKNTLGQMMYCALQKTDYRSQPFRGHRQAFEMEIYDRSAKEVIHLSQPFMWSLYCFPWDVREMEVQAPPGVVVGFVKETSHPCGPRYLIKDAKGEAVLKITGPPLAHCCRAGWDFEILDRSCKTKLGMIAGQYFGHIQGGFGDVLSVQFPQESDLKLKALLLGASILIESQI